MKISPQLFRFFEDLAENNHREWFLEHKSIFKSQESQVKAFGEALKNRLHETDHIERFKVFRIYRDVRFSKNKTPYKTHFGLVWHRVKPQYRGGYYLHLSPGDNFLACGFWEPNPADLKRIRQELALDAQEFRQIISAPEFWSVWGDLEGNELKTAPRDFDKQHPAIDLIRKKQFLFTISYTDQQVCQPDFMDTIYHALQAVRPFVDYMSEVLTTNSNGESLID